MAAEFKRMAQVYHLTREVDMVTGSLGTLYYGKVMLGGTPIDAVIDTGLSASFIYFDLFQKVVVKANIAPEALQPSDVMPQDYNRRPILIGAKLDLTIEWQGKSLISPVCLRSEVGRDRST